MAYTKLEELERKIKESPEIVEKISVLPSARVNVKVKGSTSQFYATMIEDSGRERYTELLKTLQDGGGTFDLLNKVEGKKLVYIDGKLERTVGLKTESEDSVEVEAKEKEPKASKAVAEAMVSDYEADCDKWTSDGFFEFDGVKYPKRDAGTLSENAQKLIPKIDGYVPIPEMKHVIANLRNNIPVYLEGHTGVGKTEGIKWLAKQTQNPLVIIQGSEDMETADLVGHMEIDKEGTFYVDGLLTTAVKEGYWCYISEINAIPAGVKIAMHGLLDDCKHLILTNKAGERVEAHDQFRIFSDGNPVDAGIYAGITDENLAFLNRYSKIIIDYLPERVERNVLSDTYTHVNKVLSKKIVNSANMVRKAFAEGKISGVVTTRDLKMLCQNLRYLSMDDALSMVVNKFPKEDRKSVTDFYEQHFGELSTCRASFKRG